MIIKVGHAENLSNHIKINDRSVSRNHLEVRKIDNETLQITDLNSTNGTYIDGIGIKESLLKKNQEIKIGYQKYSGEEFFEKINRYFLDPKVIWTKEFHALESDFKKFEKEKLKINQSMQTKMNLYRGLIVLTILAVFLIYGKQLGLTAEFRIIASIGGGIIAGMLVPKFVSMENTKGRLLKLKKLYSKILVCPRCKRDLSSAPYKFWKEERKCTCDAIWENS